MATKTTKPRAKGIARAGKAVKKAVVAGKKKAAKTAAKPVKKVARVSRPREKAMQAKLKLFVAEYLKANFNGTKAAIAVGYTAESARFQASVLLARDDVQLMLAKAMTARAASADIDTKEVLERLWGIATADPRELSEVLVVNCRYCWGKDHHYQWTPQRLREALAEFEQRKLGTPEDKWKAMRAPDETGGTGFNQRKDPNPQCPECHGHGEEHVVAKDTRDLSPKARLLYAGVKTTQHGMEIKTHNQKDALFDVGRQLGMFVKNVAVKGELTHRNEELRSIIDEVDGSDTGLPNDGSAD